jgi:hypothetical protein
MKMRKSSLPLDTKASITTISILRNPFHGTGRTSMTKENPPARVDPMKAWRDWFVQSEREWSESLTRMMKEDTTARAVGQEINAALYAQQMLKQGMAGSMAMMNMPTQDQLSALAERLGNLEDAVARVEVGLGQLRHALDANPRAKPERNRTSPAAATDEADIPNAPSARTTRKSRA